MSLNAGVDWGEPCPCPLVKEQEVNPKPMLRLRTDRAFLTNGEDRKPTCNEGLISCASLSAATGAEIEATDRELEYIPVVNIRKGVTAAQPAKFKPGGWFFQKEKTRGRFVVVQVLQREVYRNKPRARVRMLYETVSKARKEQLELSRNSGADWYKANIHAVLRANGPQMINKVSAVFRVPILEDKTIGEYLPPISRLEVLAANYIVAAEDASPPVKKQRCA